jgi:hypothetical protein
LPVTGCFGQSVVGQELRVDLWNRAAGYGQGVPCGTSIDTGLHVRNAAGTSLASNDDRNSTIDQCSGLLLALLPGQTVYVHTMEYGDDLAVPDMHAIKFPDRDNGINAVARQWPVGHRVSHAHHRPRTGNRTGM